MIANQLNLSFPINNISDSRIDKKLRNKDRMSYFPNVTSSLDHGEKPDTHFVLSVALLKNSLPRN